MVLYFISSELVSVSSAAAGEATLELIQRRAGAAHSRCVLAAGCDSNLPLLNTVFPILIEQSLETVRGILWQKFMKANISLILKSCCSTTKRRVIIRNGAGASTPGNILSPHRRHIK